MNDYPKRLRQLAKDMAQGDPVTAGMLVCAAKKLEDVVPYAVTATEALKDVKEAIANGLKFDGAKWLLFESGRDRLLDMIDAALAKNPNPAGLDQAPAASVTAEAHGAGRAGTPCPDCNGDGWRTQSGPGWMTCGPCQSCGGPKFMAWNNPAPDTPPPPTECVHETNRDPVAHQLSRIECFRHDAAPGASEVACALAPALAPQGWSIFLTEDGIYEWENDHWNVRIEPISDELRHQSCTKSIQGWLDAFDHWLEQYDPEAFAALRGPGLTPRHVDSLRAAFAAGSEFVACNKQEAP